MSSLKAFQVSRDLRAAEEVQICVARLTELDLVYPGALQRGEVLQRLLQQIQMG